MFEANLIEEDPKEMLDPAVIDVQKFPEAQSVAFFECRLFLRGAFEEPPELLSEFRVSRLAAPAAANTANRSSLIVHSHDKGGFFRPFTGVPVWVVQGKDDYVCPARFAHELVESLVKNGVETHSYLDLDAGHASSSGEITKALKRSVEEFWVGAMEKV